MLRCAFVCVIYLGSHLYARKSISVPSVSMIEVNVCLCLIRPAA